MGGALQGLVKRAQRVTHLRPLGGMRIYPHLAEELVVDVVRRPRWIRGRPENKENDEAAIGLPAISP